MFYFFLLEVALDVIVLEIVYFKQFSRVFERLTALFTNALRPEF